MVASLFESLVEEPEAAQHKKLMQEPLLKAAALLKEFHENMPTDFIDHLQKVDEMSEALKQPKFADAAMVIGRFMATHV